MNKKLLTMSVGFGLLCTLVIANGRSPSVAPSLLIYINHVTVIDTQRGAESPERTVIISGDRIAEVRDSEGVKVPANAKVIEARGEYLIPGLWDMHVHGTHPSLTLQQRDVDSILPLYVANGVTGVREMFGPPDANKFRAELAAKHLIAPHIYVGSPIVDGKPPVWPDSIAVETADEARKVVDEQKQRGADFIKVYSLLSREAYFAILDEARRQNIPVDGHVPNSVSLWEATAAKQRTIEHLFGMELACSSREKDLRPKFLAANPAKKEWDALLLEAWQSYSDERCKDLFGELRRNGTWPVPTLTVRHSFGLLNDPQFTSDNRVRYFSGEFRDWLTGKNDPRMKESSASDFSVIRKTFTAEEKVTGKLFRAGVPMLAGTDVGNPFCFPGFSLHDELALLVESGLTPLAALQAATRNPAIFMNATDRYGSVAKDKIADLVLLDADPLQDIHNTTKIQEVFLDGKEFDRAALDLILKNAGQSAKTAAAESTASSQQIAAEFRGFWTLNLERSDFGDRPKPKTGFVNWGEHGWTFAIVQADGRIYADAVETSDGCTFIGMAPKDLSCVVEVVTPRHVRLTVKQGATVRRIGDIELLDDGTTQTTHHVTLSQGAPYVEKTIWEKQVRK